MYKKILYCFGGVPVAFLIAHINSEASGIKKNLVNHLSAYTQLDNFKYLRDIYSITGTRITIRNYLNLWLSKALLGGQINKPRNAFNGLTNFFCCGAKD